MSVEEEIENEKKNHDELKAEIRIWERKNSEQNKKMGGVYMSAQHQQHISKKTLKMENQLQLVLVFTTDWLEPDFLCKLFGF